MLCQDSCAATELFMFRCLSPFLFQSLSLGGLAVPRDPRVSCHALVVHCLQNDFVV
jgi:hypothetical protein